jgi:hypothetical protein
MKLPSHRPCVHLHLGTQLPSLTLMMPSHFGHVWTGGYLITMHPRHMQKHSSLELLHARSPQCDGILRIFPCNLARTQLLKDAFVWRNQHIDVSDIFGWNFMATLST